MGEVKRSPEVEQELLDRMACGETLRQIVRDKHMPSKSTIMRWLDKDPEFQGRYARAREMLADHLDELIQETADEATAENAHAIRVKIDAYKWRASKLNAKRYGDKVQHTGGDGESPISTELKITFVRPGEAHQRAIEDKGYLTSLEDGSASDGAENGE